MTQDFKLSLLSQDTSEIYLLQGQDYYAADGQAITWECTDGSWPVITGGTVSFEYVPAGDLESAVTFAAEVVSGSQVQLELSAAQTSTIPYSHGETPDSYELWATLAGGHRVRLTAGAVYCFR